MDKYEVKLSFIIVNFNGMSDTLELIDSVYKANLKFSHEIIVIDNGSKNNEFEAIKMRYPSIKGLYHTENLGFAGGNNLGIDIAVGDYFYFINNDTLLPQEASAEIAGMMTFLTMHPWVGGLSPKILFDEPENTLQFAGSTPLTKLTLRNKQLGYGELDKGQYDELKPIPYLHGAAMMLPKQVIQRVGKMPAFYFLYYEELDWSVTIRQSYELFYYPGAHIYHKESASTGRDSPLKMFYLSRNRIIFAARNCKGSDKVFALIYLVFLAGMWQALKLTIQGQLTLLGAHLRGMGSGISWVQKVR